MGRVWSGPESIGRDLRNREPEWHGTTWTDDPGLPEHDYSSGLERVVAGADRHLRTGIDAAGNELQQHPQQHWMHDAATRMKRMHERRHPSSGDPATDLLRAELPEVFSTLRPVQVTVAELADTDEDFRADLEDTRLSAPQVAERWPGTHKRTIARWRKEHR